MLTLPASLRAELRDPAGPVYTDAAALLGDAGRPVVAVGDVVTRHLLAAPTSGREPPAVALVDGRTKREALPDDERIDPGGFDRTLGVQNPPGTLSAELLETLAGALGERVDADSAPGLARASTLIVVDGEEDLAALPAVAAAPEGASVIYGQPDEGMVLVRVDADSRARMLGLLARMDGDVAAAFDVLGVDDPRAAPDSADLDASADTDE